MKKKEEDIEISVIPNDKYKKFFEKFKEIDKLETKEWKMTHVLGYFANRYKQTYGVDYSWKFNTPLPSKCVEVFRLNALASKLSSQPEILKDYIDWVFINKVPLAQKRFSSISFLTKDEFAFEYKAILLAPQQSVVSRATMLPEKYKTVFKDCETPINTYGDLAFIVQVPTLSDNMSLAIKKIEQLGFDKTILDKIA
jgi:hypothetical protein